MTENVQQDNASNMPKYGLFLIHIFPYMNRIVSLFSRIGQNQRFCPNSGKCGYDSAHTQKIRIRESPYFGIFHAVKKQELDSN